MAERSYPRIYFDANPFMYAVEGSSELAEPVLELLEALRSKPGTGVTSELVLGELLAPIRRPDATPAPLRKRIYMGLLIHDRFFDLRPVSRDIIIGTSKLRTHMNLKLPDAIHVMTAIRAECRSFLSNDRDMSKGPAGLQRIRPDAEGIAILLQDIR
jgi:predicted nucleic acid-binding protein